MNTETVIKLLRGAAEAKGGVDALSGTLGISKVYVYEVLRGNKPPSPTILNHLGLEKAPASYRRKSHA
jgi:hypothetical protein